MKSEMINQRREERLVEEPKLKAENGSSIMAVY